MHPCQCQTVWFCINAVKVYAHANATFLSKVFTIDISFFSHSGCWVFLSQIALCLQNLTPITSERQLPQGMNVWPHLCYAFISHVLSTSASGWIVLVPHTACAFTQGRWLWTVFPVILYIVWIIHIVLTVQSSAPKTTEKVIVKHCQRLWMTLWISLNNPSFTETTLGWKMHSTAAVHSHYTNCP